MVWQRIVPSGAVTADVVVGVDVGDRELVVWRDTSGTAVVMAARCPHQWSHLEAEGALDGDEIVCTAHFWRFDVAGCGTKVNVKGRRDLKSDIETYPSREAGGFVEACLDRGPRHGPDVEPGN